VFFVPDSHVLGEIGRGFAMVMHEFDLSRTLIALMNIGTAQRALGHGDRILQTASDIRPAAGGQSGPSRS